jgi:hypothetical protein
MTIQEVMKLWGAGNRRTVRQACMEQPELFKEMESHLSPDDYAILKERIEARRTC